MTLISILDFVIYASIGVLTVWAYWREQGDARGLSYPALLVLAALCGVIWAWIHG